jgi:hypothetical protein
MLGVALVKKDLPHVIERVKANAVSFLEPSGMESSYKLSDNNASLVQGNGPRWVLGINVYLKMCQ